MLSTKNSLSNFNLTPAFIALLAITLSFYFLSRDSEVETNHSILKNQLPDQSPVIEQTKKLNTKDKNSISSQASLNLFSLKSNENPGIEERRLNSLLEMIRGSSKRLPAAIHFYQNGEMLVYGEDYLRHRKTENRILHLSDEATVRRIIQDRNLVSQSMQPSRGNLFSTNGAREISLGGQSYLLDFYQPGLRDDGKNKVVQEDDIRKSVYGPDHSFRAIDESDIEAIKKLREKTLSLGHGGEVVLRVSQEGTLIDKPGPDFVVFENPFRYLDGFSGERLIYQEFARVGVAYNNVESEYRWFDCKPEIGLIRDCAGVVPADEGGDQFDLGLIGISKIRYIKIKDTGKNFNNMGENAEGFDLDALHLNHAFHVSHGINEE